MTSEAVTRAKVTAARTSGGRVLVDLTLLYGQQRSKVELLLPAGLTFLPPVGTDVVVLQVGGDPGHLVALVADNPAQRVTGLAAGEIGLKDASGQQVVLSAAGVQVLNASSITITSTGPVTINASGAVTVNAGGTIKLGAGATKLVKLADGSNATKVMAE